MTAEFGVWECTAPPALEWPALPGSVDAEVCIVGAGYTGLSTALHLARQGIESIVLEAHEPGFGASGRNAGWMQPDWWHKRPAEIVRKFGRERAGRLTRWLAGGPELLASWCERYGLSTGFVRCGLLHATSQSSKLSSLQRTITEWRELGANAEFVDAHEVRRHVASASYLGGAYFRDGSIVNPLALSRELARAVVSEGVHLHARTPVQNATRSGDRWNVATSRGTVRARHFVLATDAYTGPLWPEVTRAQLTVRIAVLGSEPYAGLDSLLPTGRSFADLSLANMFSLRADAAGRLVTSTLAPRSSALSPAVVAEPVMRRFRRMFPDRAPPQWRHLHTGIVGLSSDLLPRIGRIGDNGWTAHGYSGAGINAALLMGGELASRVAGIADHDALFPTSDLDPLPLRRATNWLLDRVFVPFSRGIVSRIG